MYHRTSLNFLGFLKTSRERLKSAPYLRLNETRKPLFLQLETTKALKKLKTEKKHFPIFFSKFFEVAGQSHIAGKCKRGTLWDFLNITLLQNIKKMAVPKKGGKSCNDRLATHI